jgi:hypothetical protein
LFSIKVGIFITFLYIIIAGGWQVYGVTASKGVYFGANAASQARFWKVDVGGRVAVGG